MQQVVTVTWINRLLLLIIVPGLVSCGVNLDEEKAYGVMDNVYEARKRGSFYKEFKNYDKDEFKIVPFEDVAITLKTVIGGAGQFLLAKHISTRTVRRNQISEGLISYVVFTYEVKYSRLSLTESYFFLASSETPKLVYMTLQFL
ncbi:hypothetical protein ACVBE9_09195 [Eionea flava]